jgi:hypothetical protein
MVFILVLKFYDFLQNICQDITTVSGGLIFGLSFACVLLTLVYPVVRQPIGSLRFYAVGLYPWCDDHDRYLVVAADFIRVQWLTRDELDLRC